jgi:transcriptional regulator with GAF, ATPase, and Fis domain
MDDNKIYNDPATLNPTMEDSQISYERLLSLVELAEIQSQQIDFDEILRLIIHRVSSLLNSDAALIMIINPQTHNTVKTVIKEESFTLPKHSQYVHTTISGWVIKNSLHFLSADLKEDNRFSKGLFAIIPFKSSICIPLKFEDNIIGTLLVLRNTEKEAFKQNDLDYLLKFGAVISPFLFNKQKIQEYFHPPLTEEELLNKYRDLGLIGRSNKFIEMLKSTDAAAKCNVRVLLEGETGCGKELVAKAIHKLSNRCNQKFIVVDCAAIPINIIESELFGYVKGAFTGASTDRKGLIEESNQGTIFIDEINVLPPEVQGKFLRFIQENEIRPLGSNETKKVDVRVITATNVSLTKLVEQKSFREDLFYRLYVYPIHIPSLEERSEDIIYLANHFLKKFSLQQNKSAEAFDNEIALYLNQRKWIGNIRELENFVERIIALVNKEDKIIKIDTLNKEMKTEWKKISKHPLETDSNTSLNEVLSRVEENLIRQALVNCSWNQTKAAQSLKIPEQTLRYKMSKYGIHKSS